MCRNIIDSSGEGLDIELGYDFHNSSVEIDYGHLIYTGAIDRYYDFLYGNLPYRSLRFDVEHYSDDLRQPVVQVNYPSLDVPYTRTVEVKHVTGQKVSGTTIVREFPQEYAVGETEPYYPVPTDESKELYAKYESLASKESDVTFLGRLGTYRYYNMDQVVAMSLKAAEEFLSIDKRGEA